MRRGQYHSLIIFWLCWFGACLVLVWVFLSWMAPRAFGDGPIYEPSPTFNSDDIKIEEGFTGASFFTTVDTYSEPENTPAFGGTSVPYHSIGSGTIIKVKGKDNKIYLFEATMVRCVPKTYKSGFNEWTTETCTRLVGDEWVDDAPELEWFFIGTED